MCTNGLCLVNQKGPVTSLSQPWVDTFVYSHNTLLYNTSNTLVGAGTVRVTGMAWDKNPARQTPILKVKHICANVQHLPFKLYIRIKSFNVMMIFN